MATKNRRLSPEDAKKYDELTRNAKQLQMDLDALMDKPVTYGYARVSTRHQEIDGNSLDAQEEALKAAGATVIIRETYTGTSVARPELERLIGELRPGDTVVVAKLDRMARSTIQGLQLVQDLIQKGVTVNILNMGILSDKPEDALRLTMFLAFAQYERDMIMQRTREGKEAARKNNPKYHEGRPRSLDQDDIKIAVDLLSNHSYAEVSKRLKVSKSTLIRAKAYYKRLTEINGGEK